MILSDASTTSGVLASYGPILVATGGIMAAIVAALGRKDKKQTDQGELLDKKTNTALEGLKAALDRTENERAYWESRALASDSKLKKVEQEHENCEEEKERLKARIPPRRPRKQP